MTRRNSVLLLLLLFAIVGTARATVFGTVRGIVHDPQHRPIAEIEVVLKATDSDYTQKASTNAEGEFHFDSVPIGKYTVTVTKTGFASGVQTLAVLSGTAPILHFELQVATQAQSVTVTSEAPPAQAESVTPTTMISREDIASSPGASRTNSLAMITNYVPGSYLTHDQLHVRGGHQVSWLIDGVPIPNTNIGGNLGPQIDPKDIDVLETQRGSYAADFGDRTYAVFNAAPRTGFERNNDAELTISFGNFCQTDDQLNFGSHTNKFAYYASVNGNRTDLGLQTPTSAVIHDQANGFGGFASLIYNLSSADQFRFVTQLRRDYYQVPFDPNDPSTAGTFLSDANRESDVFAAFSWVHTINQGMVLTVSPFYHYNRAAYVSDPNDLPFAATDNRKSNYEGGQATLSWIQGPNNARFGVYGFGQQDEQLFQILNNADPTQSFSAKAPPASGGLLAAYVEDQFKVASWLTLNAGLRQTHFSGQVVENATNPRAGAAIHIPKLNWTLRGFYGQFYQAPPLLTVSGPLIDLANQNSLGFLPLFGERDEEAQVGLNIPLRGWSFDVSTFRTRARNFFDHNCINNSGVCFPVTIQKAVIRGWETTLRSPRLFKRGQLYVTYSNQIATGFGGITGGLTDFEPPDNVYFLLDHDQRNTLHVGGMVDLPWRSYASTDVYYGSGFSNGNVPGVDPPPYHLGAHTTFDLTLAKNFGERVSVSVTGLNVANRRFLSDNSFTFGGTHYDNPRELFAQVRYRFHY
jgi:TonB dependent receptor/Carboxypeptidase regulatory-like domain/TonB-dependent Receptor Plug Domain